MTLEDVGSVVDFRLVIFLIVLVVKNCKIFFVFFVLLAAVLQRKVSWTFLFVSIFLAGTFFQNRIS